MKLSNDLLHEKLLSLTREEREITLHVLHHLREAEVRKLYALRGHSSLFDYAVHELKYSEGSAQRRISAMRLLKELPELEERVESGEVKVTQLAQVQSFLRAEAKSGQLYSAQAKRELVMDTIGKSTREVAAELNPNRMESIAVDAETLKVLKEARDRFAHELPHTANLSDVIGFLAIRALKCDSMKKPIKKLPKKLDEGRSKKVGSPPALAVKRTRVVPIALKREAWKKESEGCAFVSSVNGKRCASRHRLQIDHIHPYALGGSSEDRDNLRLLCAVHNRVAWEAFSVRKPAKGRNQTPSPR